MSQHSSLRVDPTRTRHRNVLKRYERIQRLIEQEKWSDRPSAYGLPKVRSLKIKVKKAKAEKAEGEATPQATPSTSQGSPGAPEKKSKPTKKP